MKNFTIFLALLIPVLTFSQNDIEKESFRDAGSLFKAYVVAGFNLTQIDGDNSGGYNNIGANGGVGVFVNYSDKFSNSLEITYSMRGAKRNLVKPQTTPGTFFYQADYIDIPLLFNYHDFKIAIFQAGFSYSQLVRSKFVRNNVPISTENLYTWNIDLVAGVTFLIKDHWGVNFKYNYSLLNNLKKIDSYDANGDPVYKRGALIGPQNARNSIRSVGGGTHWYHNVLTFRVMYII